MSTDFLLIFFLQGIFEIVPMFMTLLQAANIQLQLAQEETYLTTLIMSCQI